jgi:hypothetical protein
LNTFEYPLCLEEISNDLMSLVITHKDDSMSLLVSAALIGAEDLLRIIRVHFLVPKHCKQVQNENRLVFYLGCDKLLFVLHRCKFFGDFLC